MTLRIDSSAFGVTLAHAHACLGGTGYVVFNDDPDYDRTGMVIFTPSFAVAEAVAKAFNTAMAAHQAVTISEDEEAA